MTTCRILARRFLAVTAMAPLATGCGSDAQLGGGGDDHVPPDAGGHAGDDGGGHSATIPFACPAGITIAPGMNTLVVDGRPRTLFADFPSDMARPIGVLFSWHGYQQTAEAFRTEAGLDPNVNPDLPVVVITPNDTDMVPPFGLGWDLVQADTNIDFALFEATLGCLNAQYSIDPQAIYSFGFSAGSVMTSLLHSSYPKLVSAIVAESGAWFNDPAQRALVTIPLVPWEWPDLDPADGGTVLLTHGGPSDVTVANIMSLEAAAQAALTFLDTHDRTVVDCAHDRGHAFDPNLTRDMIVMFLTGHRTGEAPDPTASALLPPSCHVQP
jgi:poly(3-hydroxybutyrate) depolymerase